MALAVRNETMTETISLRTLACAVTHLLPPTVAGEGWMALMETNQQLGESSVTGVLAISP